MINCKNCGGLNSEGSQVCGNCGASLIETQGNNETSDNKQDIGNNVNGGSNSNDSNFVNSTNTNNINNNAALNTENDLTNQVNNDQNIEQVNSNNNFNKNAIISIVCSVISLFIFWWLAFAGITCGVAALREIKKKGGKGKVLAILGIVVAIIDILLYNLGDIIK